MAAGRKRLLAGESIAQGGKITARAFRHVYDYLGMTMAMSAVWFLIGLLPSWLAFLVMLQVPAINSFLIFAFFAVALLGPLTAATYAMCNSMVRGEYVAVRDYFTALRAHYRRGAGLTAILLVILAILVVDLVFFMSSQVVWMQYLSVLWVYFLIFWALMTQFAFVAVVRQDQSVWKSLKVAALLALDNIVASLVVGLVGALVVVISLWMRVPLMLFLAGTLAFLHCTAFEVLVAKYGGTGGSVGPRERENNDD